MRALLRGGLAGALAGALVLGVGGRMVMRLAALIGGRAPVFSWGGTVEVLAAGGLFGAAGGLVWVAVARRLPRRIAGPALGAVTFAGVGLVSDAAQGAAASLPGPRRLTALVLFLLLCVAWGVATDIVARRWAAR